MEAGLAPRHGQRGQVRDMSHFTTLVLTKASDLTDEWEVSGRVARALAPYDEGMEVAPHVCMTAEEVREDIGTNYRRYCKREVGNLPYGGAYAVGGVPCRTDGDVDAAIDKALADARDGDDAMVRAMWHDYDSSELDADGNCLSTYNPDSKWDWYQIGGRWDGCIDNNACRVSDLPDDIDSFVFAIVTPDGKWHARGEMGWFGCVSDSDDGWKPSDILKGYQDYDAILVDCHI